MNDHLDCIALAKCQFLEMQEELDRLNGLNARLRDELVGMEEQRNALRAKNAALHDELETFRLGLHHQENATLRELVRETYERKPGLPAPTSLSSGLGA